MALCKGYHCVIALGWESWSRPDEACKRQDLVYEERLVRPAGWPKNIEIWGWSPVVSKLGWVLQPWNGRGLGVWSCSCRLGFSSLDGTVIPGGIIEQGWERGGLWQ